MKIVQFIYSLSWNGPKTNYFHFFTIRYTSIQFLFPMSNNPPPPYPDGSHLPPSYVQSQPAALARVPAGPVCPSKFF